MLYFNGPNTWQAAWAANEYSVQDSVDHEVYKMIGRHGSSLAISRGVVAEGSLRAVGSDGKGGRAVRRSTLLCECVTDTAAATAATAATAAASLLLCSSRRPWVDCTKGLVGAAPTSFP